jgi:hypothetical protein
MPTDCGRLRASYGCIDLQRPLLRVALESCCTTTATLQIRSYALLKLYLGSLRSPTTSPLLQQHSSPP